MKNQNLAFSKFIAAMTQLVDQYIDERSLLAKARVHLAVLLANETWLPAKCAVPRADRYAQYLLYCDSADRFSVVSFVWANDQRTPVHNHTVWGLVGVLRGAEQCDEFVLHNGCVTPCGHSHIMHAGDIEAISPTLGDWHRVSNADPTGVTVSIHVYGGNIGTLKRQRLNDTNQLLEFVSGYDG